MRRLLGLLLAAALLSGCAAVSVQSVDSKTYISQRRGDVLSTGKLSASARDVFRVLGIDPDDCLKGKLDCRKALAAPLGLSDEQRLSSLAELWMQQAIHLRSEDRSPAGEAVVLDAFLESARYAYAYLFFTQRKPSERAFEDRQTQVRDYYNFAVKEAVSLMFPHYQENSQLQSGAVLREGKWSIQVRKEDGDSNDHRQPLKELIPASSLGFDGVRNIYRRDGFGADVVAVTAAERSRDSFTPMQYEAISGIIKFQGNTLLQVLKTHDIEIIAYDSYLHATTEVAGTRIPLAANFTAGYGLWLSQSGFATQALRTVFGREKGVVEPHVFLMQPYDPKRRIIVMMHGLASSPEAWINVANEILGDETLRARYQIWQVYYPTNAPIVFNHANIRETLQQTLRHFDPQGTAPASRDMVLIGHSMGGVLARLMVSSSGDKLVSSFADQYGLTDAQMSVVRDDLDRYLYFTPMPEVSKVIFLASPHRGTPFAQNRLSRFIANLVRLPFAVLDGMADLSSKLAESGAGNTQLHMPNSIENLSDKNLFMQQTASIPISDRVTYHSVIGQQSLKVALADSSDGIVPYSSAHLAGAASEKIVNSGHSVQETPDAILEIRRILRDEGLSNPARK